MRHLHIIQTLDISKSGGLVGVTGLHLAMLEEGIPSRLLYVKTGTGLDAPPMSIGVDTLWSNRFHFGWNCARRVADEIAGADIVHVHGLYSYLNYVAGRECRRRGKRLIYHPHGTLAPVYMLRGKLKKMIVLKAFEERNFRHVAGWRALTESEAEQICSSVPGANTLVVSNGVVLPKDVSRPETAFPDLRLTPANGRRVFLFLSRVAAVKGLDLLFEAWLATAAGRTDVDLWIAGPDFDGMGVYLSQKVAEHELKNVKLLGRVSESEKEWLLRRADVFVLPSRGEGQSAAILEAMAYATPVLITTKCYFPLAAQSNAGFECAVTVEDLGAALARYMAIADSELQRMGANARSLVSSSFDIRKKAKELAQKTIALS